MARGAAAGSVRVVRHLGGIWAIGVWARHRQGRWFGAGADGLEREACALPGRRQAEAGGKDVARAAGLCGMAVAWP